MGLLDVFAIWIGILLAPFFALFRGLGSSTWSPDREPAL